MIETPVRAHGPANPMPTGTVTFLFTDIEGSTKRWEQYPRAMQAAIALHNSLLREAIERQGGYVFKMIGDAFCAAFPTARQALDAALSSQRALRDREVDFGPVGPIKVRMALHTGVAELHDNDYFGQPLNRVARLLSTAHGGQILLSLATEQLVRDDLPGETTLRDLGEGGLRDLVHAEHVHQVLVPDLPSEFPPLKSLDTEYVEPAEAGVALYNPYKGLRAFQETDALDFFGRGALTEILLDRLREEGPLHRFLAVVGPSGSGKSSVVRAGLVPALRQGKLPGSERWLIVEMLPGSHPLEELDAVLLSIAASPPDTLMALLREDERGLIRAVKRALPIDESIELVLVIDQFEEVFTLIEDEPSRVHFLELLCAAVSDHRSRVRVVVTLRADFFDRPLLYPDPGELMRQRTAVVLPLSAEELERAIVEPARRVGVSLEPELMAAIIKDVGEQIGSLPLLEYALTELFEQRKGKVMTLEAYQSSGGVTGALARRAEEIYEGLTEGEKEACRQLFLRLVTLGEGVEDTRRRVTKAELASIGDDTQALNQVIGTYGKYRLLTFDMDPISKGPTVEVAHEALIRTWERFRAWLDESRSDLRVQRQLMAEAAEWEHSGKDLSYLTAGTRLAQFEALVVATDKSGGVALTTEEKEYVQASIEEREKQDKVEKERQAKELELARQAAISQRAAATRLRYLVGGLALFLVVAALLTVYAFRQQSEANNQRNIAQAVLTHSEASRLAAEASVRLATDPDPQAIALLAIRSMNTEYTVQGDAALESAMNLAFPLHVDATDSGGGMGFALPAWSGVMFSGGNGLFGKYLLVGGLDSAGTLWDTYTGKVVWRTECAAAGSAEQMVNGTALSADGKYALMACLNDARLLDGQTGKEVRRFTGHTGAVKGVAFSHDGKYVLTGGQDLTMRLWDTATGREIRQFKADGDTVDAGCVAFLPDDRHIFAVAGGNCSTTGERGGIARTWDVATGVVLHEFPFTGPTVAWPADSRYRYIVTQAGEEAQLWDTDTGNKLATFPVVLTDAEISTDGKTVFTSEATGAVTMWDAQTGTSVRQFTGLTDADTLALSLDGQMLAAGGSGTELLWDVQSGARLGKFALYYNGSAQVSSASLFSPDGQYLLTQGNLNTMALWSIQALNGLPQFVGHTALVAEAHYTPDGRLILTSSPDGTVRVWNALTGEQIKVLTDDPELAGLVAISPDGKKVLTGKAELDMQTGSVLHRFGLDPYSLPTSRYSHNGKYAIISTDQTWIYDMQTYARVYTLTAGVADDDGVILEGASFSPDDMYALTVNSDYIVRLWYMSNGKEVREFKQDDKLSSAAFSPDGKYILTGSDGGIARLWDVATGKEVRRFVGQTGTLFPGAFSHDGKLVVTPSRDGTVRIWDVQTGKELRRLVGHAAAVRWAEFSPDDKMLLTASGDGTARLWYVDYHDVEKYLCGKLLRDFTDKERVRYEIKNTEPTCPAK